MPIDPFEAALVGLPPIPEGFGYQWRDLSNPERNKDGGAVIVHRHNGDPVEVRGLTLCLLPAEAMRVRTFAVEAKSAAAIEAALVRMAAAAAELGAGHVEMAVRHGTSATRIVSTDGQMSIEKADIFVEGPETP